MKIYDTVIIGSGAAGLSAAIYAGRAALDYIVIEKNYMGTGQIAESERVDNYPGLYGESGFDLGEKFRSHAEALGTSFIEGEVVSITPENGIYKLSLEDGSFYLTKTVIYAAGASHRKLGIKGEAEFAGKGVSYCAVCDGAFYRNKTAAVIGGGDTALGEAVFLSKIAEKVYLIHRRDTFRGNKTLSEQVKTTENIEIIYNAVPVEIMGGKSVESLRISQSGEERVIPVNGVFAAIGNTPDSALLNGIAELDKNGYVIAGEDCVTSAKGMFVGGDVRTKPLRQVVTAAADGANCVYSAEKYLSEMGE
ncbi:MAG: FAD-dependent oxidoreductase [Oscillospiraceae bacterium]|nr:FAD-dependent oxidoreductase [Oscillospiraceae bacterium]